MRGPQTLDQQRARPNLDPHPGFAMQRRQWKTCREKRVGTETRCPAVSASGGAPADSPPSLVGG